MFKFHQAKSPQFWSVLLLIGGLALTGFLWERAKRSVAEQLQSDLEHQADGITRRIEGTLVNQALLLKGFEGLFNATGKPSRRDFREYFQTLHESNLADGFTAVAYHEIVPARNLSRHIGERRKEGFADYHVFPEGLREVYGPEVYIEPFTGNNTKVLGFDPLAIAAERSAIERARDSGKVTISAKLTLAQDSSTLVPGFVMYVPIYQRGLIQPDETTRRDHFVGWVDAPFRMRELMALALPEGLQHIDLEVFDGPERTADTLMFDADAITRTGGQTSGLATQHIVFGERSWTLAYSALPGFGAVATHQGPGYTATNGVFISGLLSVALYLLLLAQQRRKRTQVLQAEELERKQREAIQSAHRLALESNLWAMNEAQRIGRVGTYVTDIKTGLWQGSQMLDEVFGIDATFEKTIAHWNHLIAPECQQELLDYYMKVIASDGKFHMEYEVIRPVDGQRRWVEALGEFSFDDAGNPAFLRGTISDIHKRKTAELALQQYQNQLEALVQQKTGEVQQQKDRLAESETRLTLAVEGADVGVWDLNLVTQDLYHSPRMAHMLGYAPEELPMTREAWDTLAHPDDVALYRNALQAHLKDAGVPFETIIRLRHKDGQWRWILSRGRASRDASGRAVRISGTHSDLTERKQAEERLRISEEKHRILLDESSDPIFSFYPDGRYSYVNAVFAQRLGKTASDIIERSVWDLFPKSEADRRFSFVQKIFENGQENVINVRIPTPQGDRFLITTGKPIVNAQRQVISVICISKDVTSIVEAQEAAKAANLAKSEFLSNMSHEIRTPLSGVIGMVDILEQTPLLPEQQRMLTTIHASSMALLTILNDILDFSKIEAGKLIVESIPTALPELAHSVLQLMQGLASAKGMALSLTLAPDLPPAIYTDPTRLRQVLLNLLGNAIKFTPTDGPQPGSVKLRLEPGTLPDGTPALLARVRDSGIGMSAEAKARLFTPFIQADASTSRRFGGTGLGLSITHRLVTLMGGQISVQSAPGAGSEFTVALPLQEAPVETIGDATDWRLQLRSHAPNADQAGACGQLVLLAEDNETNRDVIEEQLRLLGYACEVAQNGAIALQMWQANPERYALLLTDCHMPHMDGFSLTEAIRAAEPPGTRMPIIAITANAMRGEAQRCLEGGMDDYLSKPLRMQQLAPMLQKWLPMVELDDQSTPAIEGQTSQPLALELPIWSPATLRELVGENPAMHRRLMDKFLRSASEQVPAIGVAMAAGKLKEVAGLAHALKSAARSVGALALGELCQKMETTGNAEEAPACAALAQGLAAAFTTAQGAILEHLAHKQ